MGSPRRFLVLALTVSLGGFLVGGGARTSFALFGDQETTDTTISTAACFAPTDVVAPSVSSTVISKTVLYVPGYVRQGGTYYGYANVADAGCIPSGISTVTANVSTVTTGQTAVALVAGSYTVGGVSYNYRSASLTANTTLAEGSKAYTITSTDVATNSQTQSGYSVTVDNTRPTGTDIQITNGGATAGKPEIADVVTYTFSEPIDPEKVLAGWTGASTGVVVRVAHNTYGDRVTIRNAANSVQLPFGTVNLFGVNYVTVNRDFGATGTASTMVASGNTITVTLGTASGATGTETATNQATWVPTITLTDRAGNACQTTTATETGGGDFEF